MGERQVLQLGDPLQVGPDRGFADRLAQIRGVFPSRTSKLYFVRDSLDNILGVSEITLNNLQKGALVW